MEMADTLKFTRSYNKTLPLSDSSISIFKSYLKIYLFTLAYNVS